MRGDTPRTKKRKEDVCPWKEEAADAKLFCPEEAEGICESAFLVAF